jgi:hypothetical protein
LTKKKLALVIGPLAVIDSLVGVFDTSFGEAQAGHFSQTTTIKINQRIGRFGFGF